MKKDIKFDFVLMKNEMYSFKFNCKNKIILAPNN